MAGILHSLYVYVLNATYFMHCKIENRDVTHYSYKQFIVLITHMKWHEPETNNFGKLRCYQESHQMVQHNFDATFPAHPGPPSSWQKWSYNLRNRILTKNSDLDHNSLRILLLKRTEDEGTLLLHPTNMQNHKSKPIHYVY